MNCTKESMCLYAVTDRTWLRGRTLYELVEDALKGGATFIQLREKALDEATLLAEALEIKKLCKSFNVPFVINDNVEVARACDADGVHVGQSDMEISQVREKLGKNKIVGVSVQTVEAALMAQEKGADYLGVGAVFSTDTKKDADHVSLSTLKAICEAVQIPVVAIGGIGKDNIPELSGTGVHGVAVVSAIFAQEDIITATKKLKQLSKKMLDQVPCKVLTIAGSDCSGGAGIQADIKTITAYKMYAMSAITALTAQNTTGVYDVLDIDPSFVANQIDCIFTDIRPDAVKIGMVSNSKIIEVIAEKLVVYKVKNIVVDPVMVSTSGSPLLSDAAMEMLVSKLLPLGRVITPNIPEAEVLCGFKIQTELDMIAAAKKIAQIVPGSILIKGGHLENTASDLLYSEGKAHWFKTERVNNPNTHGTGCTLSSAIACELGAGHSLEQSIQGAKAYVTGALKAGLNLGSGSGPLNHTYGL